MLIANITADGTASTSSGDFAATSSLQITNRIDDKLIMDVGQGVALIVRASSDGIESAVGVHDFSPMDILSLE